MKKHTMVVPIAATIAVSLLTSSMNASAAFCKFNADHEKRVPHTFTNYCRKALAERWVYHSTTGVHVHRGDPGKKVRTPDWYGPISYLEHGRSSGWRCLRGTPERQCGRRTLTVGRTKCVSRGINIGVDYELKKLIPGLKVKMGSASSWSTCSARSESGSCTGVPGREVFVVEETKTRNARVPFIQAASGGVLTPSGHYKFGLNGTHWDRWIANMPWPNGKTGRCLIK